MNGNELKYIAMFETGSRQSPAPLPPTADLPLPKANPPSWTANLPLQKVGPPASKADPLFQKTDSPPGKAVPPLRKEDSPFEKASPVWPQAKRLTQKMAFSAQNAGSSRRGCGRRGTVMLRGGIEMFAEIQHLLTRRGRFVQCARHRVHRVAERGVIGRCAVRKGLLRDFQIRFLLVSNTFLAAEIIADGCQASRDSRWIQPFGGESGCVVADEGNHAVECAVQLIGVNIAHISILHSGKTPQARSPCRKTD